MRTCFIAATAAFTLTTLLATGASALSGSSYDIKVLYAGAQDTRLGCLTFGASGRFAIVGRHGSMVWAQVPEFPAQFLAVSSPLNGTGVQIFVGIHGELLPDHTLVARGINEYGAEFSMTGTARKDCSGQTSDRGADTGTTDVAPLNPDFAAVYGAGPDNSCTISFCDPALDPLRAPIPNDVIAELINAGITYGPSSMPCTTYYCDPALNPLGATQPTSTAAALVGQSFALTLGSGHHVIESCWTFTSDRQIVDATGASLTWSDRNRGNRGAGFQSVGAARDGGGLAYSGELQGNLLRVIGIEARDGQAIVSSGWGQPVAACAKAL